MKELLGADSSGLSNSSTGISFRRLNFVRAQRADVHTTAPNANLVLLNSADMPSVAAPIEERAGKRNGSLAVKPFCHEGSIQLQWSNGRKAGSGLVNLGNTCFMNSVLQCLTHTAPLAELCLNTQSLASSSGEQQRLDPVAATQAHIKRALTATGGAVQPKWHARNLKLINRRFRLGRQEDAHEYLRCVLDAMHEAFLKHIRPKPARELAATTFVHRIFGGKLRSQITCEGVDYTSSTFDPFLDLSLEITKAHSLTRALQHFTAPEVLDGDNKYRCPKNNKLVKAYKRISIDDAPNVLTVHLKRFDFFGRGHKVSKRVEFGLELDLGPYMTQHLQRQHHHKQQQQQHGQLNGLHGHHQQHPRLHQQQHGHHQPLMYDLYAVLVHLGHSLHSGHYVCYVKAGNGIWHICDDHRVAQVSQRVVESQQAYILFYIKQQPKGAPAAAAGSLPAAVAAAAQNAAVAANRLQQQKQKQQPVGGSDSTKTPLAGATAAALGQAGLVGAAAAAAGPRQQQQQQQQQQGAAAGLGPGQSGSLSAAGVARKVVTSSTESTATASPGATQAGVPEAVESPVAAAAAHSNHAHSHSHLLLRSRPIPINSFDRHMQMHRELARAALKRQLKQQRLRSNGNGSNNSSGKGHAGAQQHELEQQQQHVEPAVIDLGVIGNKRLRPEKQQQQQQVKPAVVDLGVIGSKRRRPEEQQQRHNLQTSTCSQEQASKQFKPAKQQQQQQPRQLGELLQQQVPQHAPVIAEEKQRSKRSKHNDASSQAAVAPEVPMQQQQQQPQSARVLQPKQQQQQQHRRGAAGSGQVVSVPASLQQQQSRQQVSAASVTGAAALELFMAGASSSSAGGWDGADQGLAAQAAALQKAAAQKRQRQLDEWDREYDKGKVKKVRKKTDEDDEGADEDAGVNRFQKAWDENLPQKARAESWRADNAGGRGGSSRGRPQRGGSRGGRDGGGGRGRGGFGRGGGRGRGGFSRGEGHGGSRGGRGGGRGGSRGRGGGGRGGGRRGGFQRQG